jgi:hypothetical protein
MFHKSQFILIYLNTTNITLNGEGKLQKKKDLKRNIL